MRRHHAYMRRFEGECTIYLHTIYIFIRSISFYRYIYISIYISVFIYLCTSYISIHLPVYKYLPGIYLSSAAGSFFLCYIFCTQDRHAVTRLHPISTRIDVQQSFVVPIVGFIPGPFRASDGSVFGPCYHTILVSHFKCILKLGGLFGTYFVCGWWWLPGSPLRKSLSSSLVSRPTFQPSLTG